MAVEDDVAGRGSPIRIAGAADAVAAAVAAGAVRSDSALAALTAAVLDEQAKVLRFQKERLREEAASLKEEQRLELSHLRLRRFSDYAKVAMEATAAIVIVCIVVGLGTLVLQARTANGLIAEPLKTPPDFAARGQDGTVLAQQLLDRLNQRVSFAQQYDFRRPDSIVGSWHDDTKVQIPETGVSLSELTRFLHDALGHETHVSGEVVRTPNGIALTVRAGNNPGTTFRGQESDLAGC